jgi:hypothetical protein
MFGQPLETWLDELVHPSARGRDVQLGAVARGDERGFVEVTLQALAKAMQRRRHLLGRECETTAQIQRRGRVVQAERQDVHAKMPGMGPLDALWHVGNLFVPAFALAALAAAVAKLLWRQDLAGVGWRQLAAPAAAANAAVVLAGLVTFGRDGRMATYATMVAACAITMWWRGFVRRPR